MQKPLLILVTGDPVPSARVARGDFADLIRGAASDAWDRGWSVTDLRSELYLPAPSEVSGVIVSGSPALLAERTDWMLRGLQYLRELVAHETPTLGICFGHQMLGEALGGRVGLNPKGREIGTVELRVHRPCPLLPPPSGAPGMANVTHRDSILSLPAGAERLASTALEENAAVRFARRAWGVQFHPEIDQQVMRCYIDERRDVLRAEGLNPERLFDEATDAPLGGGVVRRFIEHELFD